MDCLNCKYEDCINDDGALTYEEYQQARQTDKEIVEEKFSGVDMTLRYVTNRPDKELYEKVRDKSYERKRIYNPEAKKKYYEKNKDTILEARKSYYENNRDEVKARTKNYYEQHKDEINARKRAKRREKRMAKENK